MKGDIQGVLSLLITWFLFKLFRREQASMAQDKAGSICREPIPPAAGRERLPAIDESSGGEL